MMIMYCVIAYNHPPPLHPLPPSSLKNISTTIGFKLTPTPPNIFNPYPLSPWIIVIQIITFLSPLPLLSLLITLFISYKFISFVHSNCYVKHISLLFVIALALIFVYNFDSFQPSFLTIIMFDRSSHSVYFKLKIYMALIILNLLSYPFFVLIFFSPSECITIYVTFCLLFSYRIISKICMEFLLISLALLSVYDINNNFPPSFLIINIFDKSYLLICFKSKICLVFILKNFLSFPFFVLIFFSHLKCVTIYGKFLLLFSYCIISKIYMEISENMQRYANRYHGNVESHEDNNLNLRDVHVDRRNGGGKQPKKRGKKAMAKNAPYILGIIFFPSGSFMCNILLLIKVFFKYYRP